MREFEPKSEQVAIASQREGSETRAPGVPRGRPISPGPGYERAAVRAWTHYAPFLRLLAYYLVLIGLVALVAWLFPGVRNDLFEPIHLPAVTSGQAVLTGEAPLPPPPDAEDAMREALDRAATTALVIIGALLLVLPVAGVYMQTKSLRYDPALIRSVVILPIVVAGIALVVKNSVALAFSLAGIVAAVRFRNTLKDPRDAVYIFLTIGIGLSAGVQALDVALVMSAIFNFVVLFLWRYNVGSVYGGSYGRTGVISAGNPALLIAHDGDARRQIRRSLLEEAGAMGDTEGILLVHATDPELARGAVQEAMSAAAKEWRLARIVPRGRALWTLEYLVKLRKKVGPTDLVGALEEHWAQQVAAVEYFSFLLRERERDDADDEENGD